MVSLLLFSVNRTFSFQSDIFSLGMILFELLHPMNTAMERAFCLRDARNSKLPQIFHEKWPKHVRHHDETFQTSVHLIFMFFSGFQAKYITQMLSVKPDKRPSASEVLEGDMFQSKDQVSVSKLLGFH